MTVAQLGFSIDSSGAKGAAVDLDKLVTAAQQAERAQAGLATGSRQAQSAIQSTVAAVRQLTEAESRLGSGMAAKRSQDIAAYGAELDRLRMKFNPVFAASKAYEASLNELNMAHRVGAITAHEHGAALDLLNAQYAGVATGAQVASGAMVTAAGASRLAAHNARNLNFQLIDITQSIPLAFQSPLFFLQNLGFQFAQIGQIYMGQGGLRQALRDITGMAASAGRSLLALAAANPVLSAALAATAVAGGYLISTLFDSEEEVRSLEERMDDLTSAIDEYRSATRMAGSDTAKIVEEYGTATAAVRELIEAQRTLARDNALREAADAVEALTEAFGSMEVGGAEFGPGPATLANVDALNLGAQALAEQLGVSSEAARALNVEMQDARTVATLEEQAEALRRVRKLLDEERDAAGRLPPEMLAFYNRIVEAEDALRRLLGVSNEIPGAINASADAAAGLAEELRGAVAAADSLANASLSRLTRAQIRLDFVGDPVGEAAALAAAEFDAEVGDITGMDPLLQEGLSAQREEIIATVTEAERLTEAANEAHAAIRGRGRKRGGGGGGRKSAISEAERDAERAAESFARVTGQIEGNIQATREAISLIGLEGDAREQAIVILDAERMRREALAEAAAAGGKVTEQEIAATERLIDEWARLEAQRIATETATEEAAEAQRQAAQDAETAVRSIGDAIRGVIEGTATWQDALLQVVETLLELETVQSRIGGGAGGGGGGIFGFLGSLFGGSGGFPSSVSSLPTTSTPGVTMAPGFASGAAFEGGNVTAFARGGVVSRPTLFPMANGAGLMGEAGPEAVMPLRRGSDGKLGVASSGNGGGTFVKEGDTIVIQGGQGTPEQIGREVERRLAERDRRLQRDWELDGNLFGVG